MLYGLKNKKLKYLFLVSAVAFILVSFGVFWPKVASAAFDVNNLFTEILGNFLYKTAELLAKILVAVIQILIGVSKYNDFGNATAVQRGWVIIRDVSNMFFIVVLLMIAFGTIFKWETYRYNRLLGRLILMAFLINFSKFITLFLIDFSQVIMLTFVNAFSDIAAGNLITAFGLQDMFSMIEYGASTTPTDFSGVLGAMILANILLIIAVVTVAVLAVVLLLRILVLWMLIILSPLAYLLRTWPGGGERASSMWWSTFGKNLMNGPIIAFFLWLSLSIVATIGPDETLAGKELNYTITSEQKSEQETIIEDPSQTGAIEDFGYTTGTKFYATISKISSSDRLLSYMITISLLLGSLMVAQRMSSVGGQLAGTALGKIKGGLTKAATLGAAALTGGALGVGLLTQRKRIARGAKFAGGRLKGFAERKIIHEQHKSRFGRAFNTLRYFTPTLWKGVFKRGERLNQWAKSITEGLGEYSAEYVTKGKDAAIRWHDVARTNIANEMMANIRKAMGPGGDSRQQNVTYMRKAMATGGFEGDIMKEAMTTHVASVGNFDDTWENAMESNLINKDNYKDYGFDSYEEATHYNYLTARKALVHFIGFTEKDLEKYDPDKIMKKMFEEDERTKGKAEKFYKAAHNEKAHNELTADELKVFDEIYNKSQEIADRNAEKAPESIKAKLNALARISQGGLLIGHPEEIVALKDPVSDVSKMVHVNKAAEEAVGEYKKIETRKFLHIIASYAFGSKFFNPDTGEIYREKIDPEKLSVAQAKLLRLLSSVPARDIQQAALRIWQQIIGSVDDVGPEEAITDSKGAIYDGAEQFEEEKIQERIREGSDEYEHPEKIGRMAVLYKKHYDDNKLRKRAHEEFYQELYKKSFNQLKGEGFSDEEAKKKATAEAKEMLKKEEVKEEVERRIQEMAKNEAIKERRKESHDMLIALFSNPDTAEAAARAYRVVNYGQVTKDPVPTEEFFKVFGRSAATDFLRNPKEMREQMEKNLKELKEIGAIDDNEANERRKIGERIIANQEEKIKTGKALLDISESRQNATREKIKEQGEDFFLSDEFKKNPDKYYDQDTFKYNEKAIQALKKQVNVSKMSGIKTALEKAQRGEQAGLAIDFNDEVFKDLDLKGAGVTLTSKDMDKAIKALGDKYLEELMVKNEKLAEGEKMTEKEMLAKVEEFQNSLKNASSLRLINKNRKGIDVRHIISHEAFHDKISQAFKPEELNSMWQEMGEALQEEIKRSLDKMGYEIGKMSPAEIMDEYLAEGLANETRYALPGGIKLKDEILAKVKAKNIKIKGTETLESSPEIIEIEKEESIGDLAKEIEARKKSREVIGKTKKADKTEVEKNMRNLEEISNLVDSQPFKEVADEIRKGLREIADSLSLAAKDFGGEEAVKKIQESLIAPLQKKMNSQKVIEGSISRDEQKDLIWHFKRLVKALRERTREEKKEVSQDDNQKK